MAVGTHWPATCDVCGHVLPGQMCELRRGTCWWTGFQPPRREQNVQFRRFLYCARDSVCNTIWSPFVIKLGPGCPGVEIQSSVGLRCPMLEFVNYVRLIKHRFTSLLYILVSHWFFLTFWPVACSVRCGAFIQCGGESATDLLAARYRARANWIGPEPDSVLISVRSLLSSLHGALHCFSVCLPNKCCRKFKFGTYHMHDNCYCWVRSLGLTMVGQARNLL